MRDPLGATNKPMNLPANGNPALKEYGMNDAESKTYELVGRTTERHSCRLKARYRILSAVPSMEVFRDGEVYEIGWLRNRSHGGVLLETTHHIVETHRVELNFHSPDLRSTYRAEAIVRWVKKQDAQIFHIGLEFQSFVQL